MIVSSLKNSAEIFANPPTLFPRAPSLAAFEYVFVRENVLRYLRNSLAIALPVTLLTVVMGAMRRLRAEPAAQPPGRRRAVRRADAAGLPRRAAGHADVHHLQVPRPAEHLRRGGPGDHVEDARLRADHPAADVPSGADRARGSVAGRWLQPLPDLLAHRAADHAHSADRGGRAELRAGLRPVRLCADLAEPARSCSRRPSASTASSARSMPTGTG